MTTVRKQAGARLLALGAMLALSGCYSSGRVRDLPPSAIGEPTSRLVVIREAHFIGVAVSFVVRVDGVEVFTLRSGEYTEFAIPSGHHVLEVGRPAQLRGQFDAAFAPLFAFRKDYPMEFSAAEVSTLPGQTYYFVVGPPAMFGESTPKALDHNAAAEILSTSTFVSPTATSGRR